MLSKKPSKETMDEWHKDPSNWIWGVFYFNKEDKRFFPPKKNPLTGWTVNFANPYSIFALIALIILTVIISIKIKSA